MSTRWTKAPGAMLAALGLFGVGCNAPASDLREWKPSDHDHTAQPGRDQVDVSDPASNPLAAHGVSEVTLVAWRQNCVRCHGIVGRGDGTQAAMYRPPDLTDPQRQGQLTDADILGVIRQGRGQMPGFKLPETTLNGLVKLVRLLAGSGAQEASAEADAGAAAPAAPSPSAVPSNSAAMVAPNTGSQTPGTSVER